MQSGAPPTPPATTAEELEDQARTSAAAPPPPQQPPPAANMAPSVNPGPDTYIASFPTIRLLSERGHIADLIKAARNADLNGNDDRSPTHLLVVAPLILAYLTVDDLMAARHTLTSLPDNLLQTPLCRGLAILLASTIDRKHANVYTRAEDLKNEVSKPDFFEPTLGTLLQRMIDSFMVAFRERTFKLLANAYTSLPLPLAEKYIGLPSDQILVVAEKSGWEYESRTQLLRPKSQQAGESNLANFGSSSSLGTFNFIADSVTQLEV